MLMNSETVSKNSTGNKVDPMQIYKVIIAARNNVAEARNGPSEVMTAWADLGGGEGGGYWGCNPPKQFQMQQLIACPTLAL